jgi:Na+-transporting methylmalonyl-CoA/oxaloacetate decarboxylase gamma subunit
MREQLIEAATLIGVGMAVVFAALVILMTAIMIINRLAPEKGKKAGGPVLPEAIESEDSERGRIAALAVAVAKAMQREKEIVPEQRTMGTVGWTGEPSRWAVSGREQAMLSRGKAGRQWGRRSS